MRSFQIMWQQGVPKRRSWGYRMSIEYIAFAAFILAQIADILTTIRAINAGGYEKNPVVKWFMDKLGLGWVVVKLAVYSVAGWAMVVAGYPELLFVGAAGVGYVAYLNLRLV